MINLKKKEQRRTTTSKEKKALKKYRKRKYDMVSVGMPVNKHVPVFDKLYIYIKGSNTVEVRECWWNAIPNVLSIFKDVVKYKWLNKYYSPEELPLWTWK